jgi:hypothetical protein
MLESNRLIKAAYKKVVLAYLLLDNLLKVSLKKYLDNQIDVLPLICPDQRTP